MKKLMMLFCGLSLALVSAQSMAGESLTKAQKGIADIKTTIEKLDARINANASTYHRLLEDDVEFREVARAAVNSGNRSSIDVGNARSARRIKKAANRAVKANKALEKNYKAERSLFSRIEKDQKKQAKNYVKLHKLEEEAGEPLTPMPEPIHVEAPTRITN